MDSERTKIMGNLRALVKDAARSPAVLLFGAAYMLALVSASREAPAQALVYVALSGGILLLIWFVVDLTRKIQAATIEIRGPWLELGIALLIILVSCFVPLPQLQFGGKWDLGQVLLKLILLFVLPVAFLRLRGNSLSSMGFSLLNWKHNLKVGGIVLACLAVPTALFVGDTASLILNGKLGVSQALLAYPALFVHNLALSGLTEEVFYRAFIQTRLSQVLGSRLAGVLITSLVFGLVHVPCIRQWYPDITLLGAFARAFFMQGFMGLLLGVLWQRTHNLIPGMIVHSGINALTALGSLAVLTALP
jgi:membrane protease YdiL (CAAX protease family)